MGGGDALARKVLISPTGRVGRLWFCPSCTIPLHNQRVSCNARERYKRSTSRSIRTNIGRVIFDTKIVLNQPDDQRTLADRYIAETNLKNTVSSNF